MTRRRDPDRMMACYGVLAAWGLLILIVVRYLVGFRTLAGSLYFPTPFALPILLPLVPILSIGVGLLLAASFYTVRQGVRPVRGVALFLVTWVVVFLLADKLVGFAEKFVLPAAWMEGVVWAWGGLLLLATQHWFRLDRRSRRGDDLAVRDQAPL